MTLLTAIALTTVSFAQDDESDYEYALDLSRGTLQVGGAATANIAFIDENPDVFLIISPSGGTFVADRTLLHFDLDLLVDEVEGFDAGVSSASTTSSLAAGSRRTSAAASATARGSSTMRPAPTPSPSSTSSRASAVSAS